MKRCWLHFTRIRTSREKPRISIIYVQEVLTHFATLYNGGRLLGHTVRPPEKIGSRSELREKNRNQANKIHLLLFSYDIKVNIIDIVILYYKYNSGQYVSE